MKTAAPTYKSGALVCTKMGGMIRYSPPLAPGKSSSATFQVSTKTCKAYGFTSQSPKVPPVLTGLTWKVQGSASSPPLRIGTVSGAGMTATGLAFGGTPALMGLAGVQTTFKFSNLSVVTGVQGHLALKYPGTSGFASVVGAFRGTDQGFGSFGYFTLGVSSTELNAMYKGPGVSVIEITGGRLTLQ